METRVRNCILMESSIGQEANCDVQLCPISERVGGDNRPRRAHDSPSPRHDLSPGARLMACLIVSSPSDA